MLKRSLYHLGPLVAYHRARNRRVLTVIMFHRVLARGDRRFGYCDPEYTIEAGLFRDCLAFFRRHYHVVDLDQVVADDTHLPDFPLLITFDDGWADHEQVALPILATEGLPAVVFVAADAVDNPEPIPFWEIRLLHAFRRGALGHADLVALWRAAGANGAPAPAGDPPSLDDVRALIARLVALDPATVPSLLARYDDRLATPGDRHMLNGAELANLPRHRIAVGGHGARHRPLARVDDAAADLRRSRIELGRRLGAPIDTMSFPHGSYSADVVRHAHDAGFRVLFTSDPVLNPVPEGARIPRMLGRIGFDPIVITDPDGSFRPDLLALWLWRRRHVSPTAAR
jgi:peptidoglycan/xylan/chitin deacetylase (PgdA/CDA1 family)